jgi:hypothetical protein
MPLMMSAIVLQRHWLVLAERSTSVVRLSKIA